MQLSIGSAQHPDAAQDCPEGEHGPSAPMSATGTSRGGAASATGPVSALRFVSTTAPVSALPFVSLPLAVSALPPASAV
jgi:hypothetical protein